MRFRGKILTAGIFLVTVAASCDRPSQNRANSDAVRKSSSEVSNENEEGSLSNSNGAKAGVELSEAEKEAARKKLKEKDLGKLSLLEQCGVYGEGWQFDESAQKCYKPGEQKNAGDICKGKGDGWLLIEETGECAKASEKLGLEAACKAKGASWAYDVEDRVCYEMVGGSETTLEDACKSSASGSESVWDAERGLCTTYTSPTSPENYCVQQAKGTWNAATSECTLADGTILSLEDLAHHAELDNPEKGWAYDPVTGKFVKINSQKGAEDLCESGDNTRYNKEKNACVGVQDLILAEKVCEEKGENWEYDVEKNECVKAEGSVSVQKVCEEQGKSCLFNPATGKWEVVEGEVTTKQLCDDRGPGWTYIGEKQLCVPKGKGELTALGDGVFQDADGKKYRNVLVLGTGYPVGPYYGFGVPVVPCDENSWKGRLNAPYHYHSNWGWSEDQKWRTNWQNRYADPNFYRECGPQAMKYTAEETENLECPEGYMVDSITAQANLLEDFHFMNYIKVKCINFDKRSQGIKAGFSNDESSLPVVRCGGFNDVITGIKMTRRKYLKNFELECAPLDMDKIINGLDPVSLSLPLFTGDYMFNFDTVGDVYKGKSCNSPHGSTNRVLTGLRIKKSRVTGWIGKGDDKEYKQEWVAYSIQTVCGTLSRTSVLLDN